MPEVEHIQELEAYALGSLEPAEMAAGARHLAECPACTREVERFGRVAALLPYALEESASSPPTRTALPHNVRTWSWGLLAAAVLAALLWSGDIAIRSMHERDVVAAERTVVRLVASRPEREVAFHPMSPKVGAARATLMVGHAGGMMSVVVISHLPPAPAHMTYNLWYEDRGRSGPGPQVMELADGTGLCIVPGDLAKDHGHIGIVLMGEGKHEMLFEARVPG